MGREGGRRGRQAIRHQQVGEAGPRYLQLGAALLQGLHGQLERGTVSSDAGAHLQDLEPGAAAALQRGRRAQAQRPGGPRLSTGLARACHRPTSSAPKMAVVWEL